MKSSPMKIIEALKSVKALQVKANDLRVKIAQHSAYLSVETPVYDNQTAQVAAWLQAHEDITREIAALSVRISKTNVMTQVEIKVGTIVLKKPITEWIIRRRLLAAMDMSAWQSLTDRNLKEGHIPSTQTGQEATKITIKRCYDPKTRDDKVTLYRSEPNTIDVALETVNALTDLLD